MRLNGKVAIITGAAGAIGRASSLLFAKEGALLVLVDRDAEGLAHVAGALDPAKCAVLPADVTHTGTTPEAVDIATRRFGGVDILFANSGIEGKWNDIETYPHDEYDRVMDVNVRSVFLGIQSALGALRDHGSIVITSSVVGLSGSANNIAYTASKHAVVGLRRSAAIAGGKRGIRVNTIHPGFVESEMLSRIMASSGDQENARARYAGRAKLGRLVKPDEIAAAALFLASDESRSITNQALVVDAGVLD